MVARPQHSQAREPETPGWLTVSEDGLRWTIRTDDPRKYRFGETQIEFDVPIGLGARLSQADAANDLLTAKIYLREGISGVSQTWISSAGYAKRAYYDLLNFFRWRRRQGLRRTSSLTAEWFDQFCEDMLERGLEGLLESESQVACAIEDLTDAGFDFVLLSDNYKQPLYSAQKVIEWAGFESVHQLSAPARSLLIDHAAKLDLSMHHRPGLRQKSDLGETTAGLSALTLNARLQVWRRLWDLRGALDHDALAFNPFDEGVKPYKVARSLAKVPGKRTPTAPPLQTCFLIDRALRWVLIYAPLLREVGDNLRQNRGRTTNVDPIHARRAVIRDSIAGVANTATGSPGEPWPVQIESYWDSKDPGQSGLSIRRALIELLPAACLIVIAAFSARRGGELASLRRGCIHYDEGDPWLSCYIEKSIRDVDTIPVPHSVATAVEILHWLNQEAGGQDPDWLLRVTEFMNGGGGASDDVFVNINKSLSAFSIHVQVPKMPDGSDWVFTSHQFRRFFAILYFYRNRYPSFDALSDFLRHDDPASVLTYVTEPWSGGMLHMEQEDRVRDGRRRRAIEAANETRAAEEQEVGLELRVEVFGAAVRGEEAVGGFGGVRLMRELKALVSEARASIRLIDGSETDEEHAIDRVVMAFAARTVLDPHPDGHSYCSCRNTIEDRRAAKCAQVASARFADNSQITAPDLRFASDLVCASCPHNFQLPENMAYWTRLLDSPAEERDTILNTRLQARLSAAEEVLASIALWGDE